MGALFMVAVSLWAVAHAIDLSAMDLSFKLVWSKVTYVGIVAVPLSWWGFAAEYTGRDEWISRRNLALLAAVPVLTLLLVFTNERHRLFWSETGLDTSGAFATLEVSYGVGFWVWCAYAYALLLTGAVLVVSMLVRTGALFSKQGGALLFGVAAPWLGNALYLSGLSPVPNLDWTPFFLLLTGMAMALAISRFGLLDIVPVAWAAVVEEMNDDVIVLDSRNRILDLNPAARCISKLTPTEAIGMPADRVISRQEILREIYGGADGISKQVKVGDGPDRGHYEVTLSSLRRQKRKQETRFVVVRDVTERVEAVEEVRRLNENLERMVAGRTAELKESEEKYRSIFENAIEGIFRSTTDGRLVAANPAMARIFGYASPEDLLSSNSGIAGQLYVRSEKREEFEAAMREQGSVSGFEVEVRRKGGGSAWVSASARSLRNAAGVTVGYEGSMEDITSRVEARRILEKRLDALTGIAASMAVEQPAAATLDLLSAGVVVTTAAVACSVYLVDPETKELLFAGSRGLPEGYAEAVRSSWRDGAALPARESFESKSPLLVREGRRVLLEDPSYAPIHRSVSEAPWDTIHITPLVARSRSLGVINAYFPTGEVPDEDEATFLKAVADQAAVAVENSRLFTAAREGAALQERQRLSRELHDSVSQALYGIALGARTARTLLDRDPSRLAEPMEYVLSLAEAGLAEMRALIFELRPEALESEGLVVTLERQAAALRARHGIEVCTTLCEEPLIPAEQKEALYRIVREALQNTVKHSGASKAGIILECTGEGTSLEVCDNGRGFDPAGTFPGHLGIKSMRERAERLGGTLHVYSAPGAGARVRVHIPV